MLRATQRAALQHRVAHVVDHEAVDELAAPQLVGKGCFAQAGHVRDIVAQGALSEIGQLL